MYSYKLIARPGELLIDHCKKVAETAVINFRQTNHNLAEILKTKDWENLVYITGFSHDFGKATSYFQKYVTSSSDEQAKLRNHPETNHGLLSAIFTHWLIKTYLAVRNVNQTIDLILFLPFLFFLIVKKHHGNFKNPLDDELFSRQFNYLKKQSKHIDSEELQQIIRALSEKIEVDFKITEFPADIDLYVRNEFKSQLHGNSMRKIFAKKYPASVENYVLFQFFNSLLLHSDKTSVIFDTNPAKRKTIEENAVDKYKMKQFTNAETEINKIREEIYAESLTIISKVDLEQKIYSLNVPTGTGKTLTALSVALKLRQRLQSEKGQSPRIIYSLPFTSIIDQNFNVFQEVFNNPSSDVLLKHHSLADIFYRFSGDSDKEYDVNKSQFLIESWESEIIVTTFMQLFHTLFTNNNRSLKKFSKLANAIILLDEVQSIPIKYWLLVRHIFLALSKVLNTYVVLITATQPRIFPPKHIVEIAENKNDYFRKLNRVQLEFNNNEIFLADFCDLVYDAIKSSNESYLIVLNTIYSSLAVFNSLIHNNIDAEFYYLSTNIIPKERLKRITAIKQNEKRKIIISTQLIEAGVDIDIENVWRDFAPLDSINQASGRCNRNLGNKKGKVKIFQIKNDQGRYFYKYIYGDSVLSVLQTRSIFDEKHVFEENEFLNNIDIYYEEIEKRMSNDDSEKIIEQVKNLRFDEIGKFTLIEDDEYYKQDVFVEIDDAAEKVWQNFSNLKFIDDPIQRKNEFLRIKKEFYEYVISVPRKCLPDGYDDGIYHLCKDQADEFYDSVTGFKLDKQLPQKTETGFY